MCGCMNVSYTLAKQQSIKYSNKNASMNVNYIKVKSAIFAFTFWHKTSKPVPQLYTVSF